MGQPVCLTTALLVSSSFTQHKGFTIFFLVFSVHLIPEWIADYKSRYVDEQALQEEADRYLREFDKKEWQVGKYIISRMKE